MVVHSAYMLINKAIPSSGGPYTVRFYDDNGTLIQTDTNVPQYGTAHCTLLDGTIVDGLYFKGWNPSPSVVTRNLDCYPVRGDYIIRHEETHDSWETICVDRGAHYPLGTYKSLVVTIPPYTMDFDFKVWDGSSWVEKTSLSENIGAISLVVDMIKVAEGEDNSVSTWITSNVVNVGTTILNNDLWVAGLGLRDQGANQYTSDWGDSAIRKYLNSHFVGNLPTALRETIVQVTKSYMGYTPVPCTTSVYPSLVNKESLDKVWMLSKKELYTKVQNYTNITYWSGFEDSGIDYSFAFDPITITSQTNSVSLRSSGNYGNRVNDYVINIYRDSTGGSSDLGSTNGSGRIFFGFCL